MTHVAYDITYTLCHCYVYLRVYTLLWFSVVGRCWDCTIRGTAILFTILLMMVIPLVYYLTDWVTDTRIFMGATYDKQRYVCLRYITCLRYYIIYVTHIGYMCIWISRTIYLRKCTTVHVDTNVTCNVTILILITREVFKLYHTQYIQHVWQVPCLSTTLYSCTWLGWLYATVPVLLPDSPLTCCGPNRVCPTPLVLCISTS